MSLTERLNDNAPATDEGSVEYGPEGGEFRDIKATQPLTDWAHVFERFNLNPEEFEIVGDTVRCSTWQQSKRTDNGDRDIVNLYSYRAQFRRRMEAIDLPSLMAEARATKHKPHAPVASGKITHVLYGDPQWGKSGSRGELAELLARVDEKRDALEAYMHRNPSQSSYFWDAGDGIENVHNVASQLATNNLSVTQQVDAYATDMWKFVRQMARHGPVDTVIVPSNHAQLRIGKQLSNKPTDDWGVHVHQRNAYLAQEVGLPVTAHFPNEWDEAVSVQVGPVKIGLTHGHQARSLDAVPDMWKNHTHGAGALHDCDILLSGHWHVPKLTFTGRSPRTGRSKIHIAAGTLDNGSDWWRNIDGADSDPVLVVFQTDETGFDLSSFALL
ncbi:hypothetical protein [Microbacterium testaceum]|uniref:hypothetical protein n=1 Tax=Microbacterium testaceum TaxID=2033 RepID=UPI000734A144|nr:hypothetical protein [Microbacterium testaceum]